ncbi:MAG: hypothetical protein V3T05_05945 [Myxococcota bacterium]
MSRATIGIAVTAALAVACESDDLGQPCGTTPTAVTNPIVGEVPIIEVVRLERDGECESFQCLTHRGISPYCTRECERTPPENAPKRCTADADCTGGDFRSGTQGHCVDGRCACKEDFECSKRMHCADGVCSDDDCPKGFWCKEVQEVGPLVGKLYCVFKDGCDGDNIYCEDLGNIVCRSLACFDACLREYWVCQEPEKTSVLTECEELECYAPCMWQGGGEYFCTESTLDGKADDPEDKKRANDCRAAGCYDATLCVQQLRADCTFDRLVCEPRSDDLPCDLCIEVDGVECPPGSLSCSGDAGQVQWVASPVEMCLPKDF